VSRRHRDRNAALVRWFPRAWRARYGDEFLALLEDSFAAGRIPALARLSVARAGIAERLRAAALVGDAGTARVRIRSASLLVLCAWAAVVVAGASFAKLAEGFRRVVPNGARPLSTAAYDAVFVAAMVGVVVVACGAAVVLSSFVRFVRDGGWTTVRRPVVRAFVASVIACGSMIGLVALARTLTSAQRGGQLLAHPVVWYYLIAFVVTGLGAVVTIVLLTTAVVVIVNKLELSARQLRFEAVLACILCAAMFAITAATVIWWATMGSKAPWFLAGSAVGTKGSLFDPQLVATVCLMLIGCALAGYGARRITRT